MDVNATMLLEIKKYYKIYLALIRFAAIDIVYYRASFILGMLVDFGYVIVMLVFFHVVYGNIDTIAGWDYYEMLFFMGLNTISWQILLITNYVYGGFKVGDKIKSGEMDLILLKPVNSLFLTYFGKVYLTGFAPFLLAGYLIYTAVSNLDVQFNAGNLLSGGILFVAGLVITNSIMIIITSLAFKFTSSSILADVARDILKFGNNPHQIYQGLWQRLFYFIFPVIFISSIPAQAFLHGVSNLTLALGVVAAIISVLVMLLVWNKMLKYYTSASS